MGTVEANCERHADCLIELGHPFPLNTLLLPSEDLSSLGQLRPTAKGTPKAKVEKEVSQNLVIRNVGVKKKLQIHVFNR